MLDFPRLVFKDGGPHSRAGGSYSYKLVEDIADLSDALLDGWSKTLPEAIEGITVGKQDAAPKAKKKVVSEESEG